MSFIHGFSLKMCSRFVGSAVATQLVVDNSNNKNDCSQNKHTTSALCRHSIGVNSARFFVSLFDIVGNMAIKKRCLFELCIHNNAI